MPSTITSSGQTGFAVPTAVLIADIHATDATVASNALRISLKTPLGNNPSPTEPLFTTVRATDGTTAGRAITNTLSLTISSGSTLGASPFGGGASSPFRIWVVLFDDSGTFRLAVQNCLYGDGTIFPLIETGVASAIAEGGSGAADSSGVLYASQAVTSKFFRIVGYMEWLSGFPGARGAWSVLPDNIRLFGPGVQTPGTSVQQSCATVYVGSTTTSLIPLDGTIPQSNEGAQLVTTPSLLPQSPCNIIEFDALINVSHSVASSVIGAIFRDAETDAEAVGWCEIPSAGAVGQVTIRSRLQVSDANARTYTVNIGAVIAGTLTINGTFGVRKFAGYLQSVVRISELMV